MRLFLTTIILTMLAQPLVAGDSDNSTVRYRSWWDADKCTTTRARAYEIYNACYLSKLPEAAGLVKELQKDFERAAVLYCRQRGCNPSLLDRLRY